VANLANLAKLASAKCPKMGKCLDSLTLDKQFSMDLPELPAFAKPFSTVTLDLHSLIKPFSKYSPFAKCPFDKYYDLPRQIGASNERVWQSSK
jgi:hypothetical protein